VLASLGLSRVKNRAPASTHKKVVVLLLDRSSVKGYLNAAALGLAQTIDLLTTEGEHSSISLGDIKAVYFVREFDGPFELERKTFMSRPKLDGLWVRLRFRDDDAMEGIVSNNLLDLLDTGVQLTPPDLHGNIFRMFIPRSALSEVKVLGVVGAARRMPTAARAAQAALAAQSKLFGE
jgi:hypothetical protein